MFFNFTIKYLEELSENKKPSYEDPIPNKNEAQNMYLS